VPESDERSERETVTGRYYGERVLMRLQMRNRAASAIVRLPQTQLVIRWERPDSNPALLAVQPK